MKNLLILIILLTSCANRRFTQKAYIAQNVYKSANCVVHQFVNLSYTEARDELLDSAICAAGDTLIIKDYFRFFSRKTCFYKP